MRFVYNSFYGRYSDNPRAVHEGLLRAGGGHSHVWLQAEDQRHGFPDDVDVVPIGSEECRAVLESADVVVSNTYLELDWTKGPSTTYLQTWHGTPLKRIHHDAPPAGPENRLQILDLDVARWDVLLSPNRLSTERLRNAFRYDGRIAETGYPRNDALLADDRDRRRTAVRADLGLAEGTTAVLYAPTWRDDEYYAADVALGLDVARFADTLGEDWCLLPRIHYYMADRFALPQDDPRVRDVSHHPDIADLYLAADVMITDYSSAMVDFATTGKPMVFFPYDLAHYRDTVRGFYVDPFAGAPGPVVHTMPELLAALSRLDDVEEQYRDRYETFRRTWCHLEDGRATDRVVDLLLGRAGTGER